MGIGCGWGGGNIMIDSDRFRAGHQISQFELFPISPSSFTLPFTALFHGPPVFDFSICSDMGSGVLPEPAFHMTGLILCTGIKLTLLDNLYRGLYPQTFQHMTSFGIERPEQNAR